MASRTAPRKGSRSGSGSGSGSSTGPAGTQKSTTSSTKPRSPKLRDSCDPCAAAKVRCTKQKPICTRCEKRGIQCEYIVTRRAGRPSQNASRTSSKAMDFSYDRQQDDMLGDSRAASPPSPPKTTSSEKGFFTSGSLIESNPLEQQMDICRTYSLPNLHEPCSDSLSDSPSLRCFADEVDSFFATLESLPGLDTSSRDMLNLPTHIDPLISSANPPANDPMMYDNMIPQTSDYDPPFTEDPCLDLLQLTPQWQSLPQASPTITNSAATPTSHTGPCSCLTTALGLIRDFGSSDSSSMAWPHQKLTGGPSMLDFQFPTRLQSLISSNESILNTVTQILSCPCSQDIYLLTMLSLVVFKVLDRYAAAATMTTEGNSDPRHHHNNNTSNNNSKFRSHSSSNSSQASIRHTNSTPSLSPTSFSTTSSTNSSSIPHHHQHHHQAYHPPYPFTSAPARPSLPTTTTTTTTTTANDGTFLFLTSDTDPRRVSAQLVLGELHRAQRLVNELSTRFRSLGLTAGPASNTSSSSSNHNTNNDNTNATAAGGGDDDVRMDGTGDSSGGGPTNTTSTSSSTPISTTMLEHLEKDLRARVRGVSKGVVEVIRRF